MTDISDERKKSVIQAIERFTQKALDKEKPKPSSRKNDRPEKEVEKACVVWLKSHGFDGQVYEAKSVLIDGVWRNPGMKAGTADWGGTSPDGFSVSIEFKAPGKRSTFWRDGNERQQAYILSKLDRFAFAVVVDRVSDLASWYELWLKARESSPHLARSYLYDLLPRKPKERTPTNSGLGFDVD